jgi:hypothetical protein
MVLIESEWVEILKIKDERLKKKEFQPKSVWD